MIALAAALVLRDIRRLARRPGQIIASIATPVMLWLVLAGGFAGAMRVPGADAGGYSAYLANGFALLVVVFSSIFAAHALIEDRRDGFLTQTVLSGRSPMVFALARTASGAAIAWVQAAPLLLLAAGERSAVSLAASAGWLAIASVGVTAVGLAIATRCATARSFHGFMNVVLMPAWLLSGAVFPLGSAHAALRTAAMADPLAWIHTLMRGEGGPVLAAGSILFAVGALAGAALAMRSDRSLLSANS